MSDPHAPYRSISPERRCDECGLVKRIYQFRSVATTGAGRRRSATCKRCETEIYNGSRATCYRTPETRATESAR